MKLVKLVLVLIVVINLVGCSTGVVPPGTTVIITKTNGDNVIYTKGKYTATGRDRIYFLDTKLKSFTETLNILCKDKVNMKVDIKWIGSFIADTENQIDIITKKVPITKSNENNTYHLSLSQFYSTAVADIIRSNSRMIISPYVTDTIPEQRQEIEKTIRKAVLARLTKLQFPLKTSDLMVSNLDFDPTVTAQRTAIKKAELDDELKAATAKAAVAQAKRDADIAREKGKALIEQAKAKAAANKILDKSITPNILAIKQWEVLELAATSPNNQFWVLPYEALKTGVMTNVNLLEKRGR